MKTNNFHWVLGLVTQICDDRIDIILASGNVSVKAYGMGTIILFLLNVLGLHWLIKLYRFKVYISILLGWPNIGLSE